jgi:hypothetical protein
VDILFQNNFNTEIFFLFKKEIIMTYDDENMVIEEPKIEQSPIEIHVDFGTDQVYKIDFINLISGKEGSIQNTHKKPLVLKQGQAWKLPIDNKTIKSDEFLFMKIFSNVSEDIDIRYIRDGIAYVVLLKSKIIIENNTLLCVLWK